MELSDLIILASSFNLMPNVEYREKILLLDGLSDNIRSARNMVHPGILLRAKDPIIPSITKKGIDLLHDIFQMVKKINKVKSKI